jgi:outer membrane receptor protein involved in Fe transport
VSRYVGRIGAEWVAGPSFAPRVQLRLAGPYTPIGEPTVRTRSYATLDLGAALRPRGLGVTIDLDLTNVFDTKYPEIRASGFLNPGAPRTARIGLRFADRP